MLHDAALLFPSFTCCVTKRNLQSALLLRATVRVQASPSASRPGGTLFTAREVFAKKFICSVNSLETLSMCNRVDGASELARAVVRAVVSVEDRKAATTRSAVLRRSGRERRISWSRKKPGFIILRLLGTPHFSNAERRGN